jgi:hypothetical protein
MTETGNTASSLPPNYRVLKAVVIILGVLILLAFGALIAGFIVRLGRVETGANRPFLVDLAAAPEATVVSSELQDNRLVLRLKAPKDEEIVILDANSGREIGRVRLKPQS